MDEVRSRGWDPRARVRGDARGRRGARRRIRRPLRANGGPIALVVDDGSDELGVSVAAALRRRGLAVNAVPARQLALVPLELDACDAAVAGRRVGALLFRARPGGDFAGGFAERDASFSSSEARAAWLAVMALPTVAVVNRFSAEMCFSFGEWPTWWRRVREAGIATAEIAAGGAEPPADARWLPWGGGVARVPSRRARRAFGAAMVGAGDIRHSTWCYGEVIAGPDAPAVRAIGGVLASHGVNLALIATTDDGRYVTCNPHATLPAAAIGIASRKIATVLGGHLRRR